jgi:hypothetical protein
MRAMRDDEIFTKYVPNWSAPGHLGRVPRWSLTMTLPHLDLAR